MLRDLHEVEVTLKLPKLKSACWRVSKQSKSKKSTQNWWELCLMFYNDKSKCNETGSNAVKKPIALLWLVHAGCIVLSLWFAFAWQLSKVAYEYFHNIFISQLIFFIFLQVYKSANFNFYLAGISQFSEYLDCMNVLRLQTPALTLSQMNYQ